MFGPAVVGAASLTPVALFADAGTYAATKLAATLVPEVAADVELRDDRVKLLRFVEPQPGRSIGLAWRRTSPRKVDFLALGQMVKNALKYPAEQYKGKFQV